MSQDYGPLSRKINILFISNLKKYIPITITDMCVRDKGSIKMENIEEKR
jgi:hypothetical protein